MRTAQIAPLALTTLMLASCAGPAPKPYSNAEWGFGVTFHGDPKVTNTPASSGNPKSFQAEVTAGGRHYVVLAMDATVAGKSPDQLVSQAPGITASDEGGVLGMQTYVATGKVDGREFIITRPNQPVERDRVFVANGKYYQLITQSPYGARDSQTQAFLDSFHITQ